MSWLRGNEYGRAPPYKLPVQVVAPMSERCLPLPHSLPHMVGKRAGPKVMRVGEMALSFIGYNTWENRCCILPGKPSRAGPENIRTGELVVPLGGYVIG